MATLDDFLTAVVLSRSKGGEDHTWHEMLREMDDASLRRVRGDFSTGESRMHLLHDATRQAYGATLSQDPGPFQKLKESVMPVRKALPPGRGERGLARLPRGLAVRNEPTQKEVEALLAALGGDGIMDAEFTEVPRGRRYSGVGGPQRGPSQTIYAGPVSRPALGTKALAKTGAAAVGTGVGSSLAKVAGRGAKGLLRFLGPAAVALAAADLVGRVVGAGQGNIDRQRAHREGIADDLLQNVGLGVEEIGEEATGRALQGIGNTQRGFDLASAIRAPQEDANELTDLMMAHRAELQGVSVRAQPGEDEFLLAMRRFM